MGVDAPGFLENDGGFCGDELGEDGARPHLEIFRVAFNSGRHCFACDLEAQFGAAEPVVGGAHGVEFDAGEQMSVAGRFELSAGVGGLKIFRFGAVFEGEPLRRPLDVGQAPRP